MLLGRCRLLVLLLLLRGGLPPVGQSLGVGGALPLGEGEPLHGHVPLLVQHLGGEACAIAVKSTTSQSE